MINNILALSVFIVLVVGGIVGAIVKFTLWGTINSNVGNRINEKRFEEILDPSSMKNQPNESVDILDIAETEFSTHIDHYSHSSNMKHVMS